MSNEASLAGFFTSFFLGLPLTLVYLTGLVLSMMAKKRIGNAANFAIGGFAFFLVSQCVASVVACVTWFLVPSAGKTSMVFISLIVKTLVCGFMQMVALALLIAAFAKRVNAELPLVTATARHTPVQSQTQAPTHTQTSVQTPNEMPVQTQTRVQKHSEDITRSSDFPDDGADPDAQTRTRIQK